MNRHREALRKANEALAAANVTRDRIEDSRIRATAALQGLQSVADEVGQLRTDVDLAEMTKTPDISIRCGVNLTWYWKVGNVGGETDSYDKARSVAALEAACQFFDIPVRQPNTSATLAEWSNEDAD